MLSLLFNSAVGPITFYLNNVSASGSNFLRLDTGIPQPNPFSTSSKFSANLTQPQHTANIFKRDQTQIGIAGVLNPPTAPSNTNPTNAWRTERTYTRSFAAGFWEVFANMDLGGGLLDGWYNTSIYRGTDPTGVGATLVASGGGDGGITVPQFSVTNEYIFVSVAWEAGADGGTDSKTFTALILGSDNPSVITTGNPVGIAYTQSVNGTLASIGDILKQPQPVKSGTLTSSGVLSKLPQRSLLGTLTSSGALTKQDQKALFGTLTSSGVLAAIKIAIIFLAGTLTSAGTLIKQTGRNLAGTLTSSGTLIKQIQRALAGTLTSSGTLVKQTLKVLSGILTSAGALAATKVAIKVLTGTLTSSGTLIKQTSHLLSGTFSSSGTIFKQIQRAFTGTLTSAGSLVRQTLKVLSGALTSSGVLAGTKVAIKLLTGTLTSSGTLIKQTSHLLSGTLTSSGTILKQAQKILSGTLTSIGSLIKQTRKILVGTLTSSGALITSKAILKSIAGTLTSSGTLVRQVQKNLTGTFTSSGTHLKKVFKDLTGVLAPSGTVAKRVSRALQGTLSFVGTIVGFIVALFPPVTRATIRGTQALFSLLGIKSGISLTGKQALFSFTGVKSGISLTGKQRSVTIMAAKVDIPDLPLGDDFIIALILTNPNGTPFDLSGGGIVTFAMKTHSFDSPYTLQKSSATGGIVITSPTGGLANLLLDAVDSSTLAAGPYDYSVKAVSGSGKKNTQILGKMFWIDHPSKLV